MYVVKKVTILILIDGFLQCKYDSRKRNPSYRHNPYFNRWFSAICLTQRILSTELSHNPYFNRWFSAMQDKELFKLLLAESQSLF